MRPTLKVARYFFDKTEVINRVGKARVKVLSKLGAFIMTRARRSMKQAPRKPPPGAKRRANARSLYSMAGNPPYAREGSVKRYLFFSYDPNSDSVVVGPMGLHKSRIPVPETLEYGGTVTIKHDRVTYKPRPFMVPAYEAEIRVLPRYMKDML